MFGDTEHNRKLDNYLAEQGIEYKLSAEFAKDMVEFGFKVDTDITGDRLLKIVRVLLEEHELSAIMLSVDGVSLVRNRSATDLNNKIRKAFKWNTN